MKMKWTYNPSNPNIVIKNNNQWNTSSTYRITIKDEIGLPVYSYKARAKKNENGGISLPVTTTAKRKINAGKEYTAVITKNDQNDQEKISIFSLLENGTSPTNLPSTIFYPKNIALITPVDIKITSDEKNCTLSAIFPERLVPKEFKGDDAVVSALICHSEHSSKATPDEIIEKIAELSKVGRRWKQLEDLFRRILKNKANERQIHDAVQAFTIKMLRKYDPETANQEKWRKFESKLLKMARMGLKKPGSELEIEEDTHTMRDWDWKSIIHKLSNKNGNIDPIIAMQLIARMTPDDGDLPPYELVKEEITKNTKEKLVHQQSNKQ